MIYDMRKFLVLIAVAAALTLFSPQAMGQLPKKPGPPPTPEMMMVYGGYIAAAVLLGCALIGAFKSSKRTKQEV